MSLRSLAILLAVIAGAAAFERGTQGEGLVSHFYYMDDDAAWESLSKNVTSIGLLSPVWVKVRAGGEVQLTAEDRVKQLASRNNVPLLPVVMNEDFQVEAARAVLAPERQAQAVAELAAIAKTEGFHGLQVDFENLEPAHREPFAAFVERLAAALHEDGKLLSVAVVSPLFAPVPSGVKAPSWQATSRSKAYDYERIGRAADFVTLMTYDQYTSPGAPGPVAGMDWMEACLRKTLEAIPASKLLLGVPLYHRHWAGSEVMTGSWNQMQSLLARPDAELTFDGLQQEPVVRFREGTVDHTVWFHNSFSFRQRARLARKYKLRGFSAWRIGQEDPAVWTETRFETGAGK